GSRSLEMTGNAFATVPTGHFGFTTEMDFTVEFWFKSAANDVTLFANGKGTDADESEVDWSIDVDTQSRIVVNNNGFQFVATDSNFMDNDWHHFALAINRLGNTRAYVDGNLQNQIGSESFTGFGSDKAWVGARGWKHGTLDSTDRYYTGNLDELRIWGVARTQEQIMRERNYRLLGNEFGLLAYYPFEAYQEDAAGIMLLEETVEDQIADTVFIVGTLSGPSYSPETPRIKLQRPIEYVNFVYSVNGDKIIISPTDDDARLENTILDITVRGIQDNNGNTMQSPVTWTAFIDRNQTVWDESNLDFVMQVGEELTFTTQIKNKGGNLEEFTIDNLPAWLTASPAQGSISPLSTQEITFTVNSGLNIGQYDESLHLRTSFGFNEVLHLGMTVYQQAPNWTVNPSDYEYSMSMIGHLKIEGLFSTDENDLLGAFIDGECRGVVPLQYVEVYDTYLGYLNIYSDVSNGEPIVFQIWDASEGQILTDVTPYIDDVPDFNYTFSANEVVGTSSNPVVFSSNQGVLEQRNLPRGWKWISFHLDSDMLARTSLTLQHLDLADGDIIWSGDGMFDQYDSISGLWIGTLAGDNLANGVGGLLNTATYKLKLANETQLTYQGAILEPSANPVTINRGWNWIGFVSRRNLDLNEALANYDAQPGDVIKSQYQFAMFDEAIGWIGSLRVMQPGEGYMLWTDSVGPRTYVYPREGIISGRGLPSARQLETQILEELPFDPYQYPSSMSVVCELDVALHEISEDDRILAYIKDEVHGVAQPVEIEAVDHPRFLFTIYGGAYEEDAEISFVWQDAETGDHMLLEMVRFQDLRTLGTVFDPVVLTPEVERTEEGELVPVTEPQLFPNPFVSKLDVMVPMATEETEASITVLNVEGKVIQNVAHLPLENGVLRWSWDGTTQIGKECPSGLYLVRVSAGEEAFTFKVVRQ
ncbi:MAG: LamG-like jellyroll fold domain-containing protein, partial [Bacteroidota bacterium]